MDGNHLLDASIGEMINFTSPPLPDPPAHDHKFLPTTSWPRDLFVTQDNNPFDALSQRSEINATDDPFEMASCNAAAFQPGVEAVDKVFQPGVEAVDKGAKQDIVSWCDKNITAASSDDSSSRNSHMATDNRVCAMPDVLSTSILNASALCDDNLLDSSDVVCPTPDEDRRLLAAVAWDVAEPSVMSCNNFNASVMLQKRCKPRSNSCTATCEDTSVSLNTAFRCSLSDSPASSSGQRSASCCVATPDTMPHTPDTMTHLQQRLAAVVATMGNSSTTKAAAPHNNNSQDLWNKALGRRCSSSSDFFANSVSVSHSARPCSKRASSGTLSSLSDFSMKRSDRGSLLFHFDNDFIYDEAKELAAIFQDKADNFTENHSSDDDCDDLLTSRPPWEKPGATLPSDDEEDDVFLPNIQDVPPLAQASLRPASLEAALPLPPGKRLKKSSTATAAKKGPMRAVIPLGDMITKVKQASPTAALALPCAAGSSQYVGLPSTPLLGPPIVASTPLPHARHLGVTQSPVQQPPPCNKSVSVALSCESLTPPRRYRHSGVPLLRRSTSASSGLPSPGARRPAPSGPSPQAVITLQQRRSVQVPSPTLQVGGTPKRERSSSVGHKPSPHGKKQPLAFKSPNTKQSSGRVHSLAAIKSLFTSKRSKSEKENFQLA